jgi:hypothetical protein
LSKAYVYWRRVRDAIVDLTTPAQSGDAAKFDGSWYDAHKQHARGRDMLQARYAHGRERAQRLREKLYQMRWYAGQRACTWHSGQLLTPTTPWRSVAIIKGQCILVQNCWHSCNMALILLNHAAVKGYMLLPADFWRDHAQNRYVVWPDTGYMHPFLETSAPDALP